MCLPFVFSLMLTAIPGLSTSWSSDWSPSATWSTTSLDDATGRNGGIVILPTAIDIAYAPALQGGTLLLIHEDLSTTTVRVRDVVVLEPEAGGPVRLGLVTENNTELTAEWTDGTYTKHVVRTPCKGLSRRRCAEVHKEMLDIMQGLFPPA